jgi:histidinol phosphatase-like PHP family hydrolase
VIADNHNHFLMAGDIDLILGAAAEAPIDEIAFCEHVFNITEARESIDGLDRIRPEGSALSHGEYLRTVHHAAERAAIPVRVGMELDVRPDEPEFERQMEAFVDRYGEAWDVAIGSVHTITGRVSVHALPSAPAEEAWDDYVDRLLSAVSSGRFDVVSHPVRLGTVLEGMPEALPDRLGELAASAAEADVALEVNGSDYRQRPDLVEHLIRACVRSGTAISLGSDAHVPRAVGRVANAVPLLRELGVTNVARFVRRSRELVPL